MSYSMLSTKRKFHRLLDSLSNGTPTSNASDDTNNNAGIDGASQTSEQTERPAKRIRPAVKQRSQLVSSSPQLSLLLTRHAAASRTTLQPGIMNSHGGSVQRTEQGEVSRVPATTWNPKDKSAFMERVETFQSPGNWTFKRDEICAVAFAKWGWRLVDVETVECVSCHRRFVVYVRHYPEKVTRDPVETVDAGDENDGEEQDRGDDKHSDTFVEKTIARLESEHDSSCLWRKIHCDDSIWSLTMWPANTSLEALRRRYRAILMRCGTSVPKVVMPEELQTGDHEITTLTVLLDNLPSNRPALRRDNEGGVRSETATDVYSRDIRQRALAIALLGWDLKVPELAHTGSTTNALFHCGQCLARVGLWLFSPQAPGKEPVYHEFEIAHHSMGCPWSNAESQNGGMALEEGVTPKAAWEILAGMLVSQAASAQRQREDGGRGSMDESRPTTPSGTPKLTDEERKKKHKLGMAWLSKLKLGHNKDK